MSLDGDERETQLSAKSMEEIRSNSTSIGRGGRMSCRVFYEINLRDYISARLSKPERWRNRVMHGRKDSRLTKFRNSNRVQKRTNERTSERTRLERVGLAVGASLSQSHQTTVIATGATSHRALDAQANTITPSFGTISFSLSLPFSLSFSAACASSFRILRPSSTSNPVPDVSIARLHAPPRRWITRRRECYRQVINPRARKENEFNDPELSHRLLP